MKGHLKRTLAALIVAGLSGGSLTWVTAQQPQAVAIDPDDIGGMLSLFINFNNISYIKKAIAIWGSE